MVRTTQTLKFGFLLAPATHAKLAIVRSVLVRKSAVFEIIDTSFLVYLFCYFKKITEN